MTIFKISKYKGVFKTCSRVPVSCMRFCWAFLLTFSVLYSAHGPVCLAARPSCAVLCANLTQTACSPRISHPMNYNKPFPKTLHLCTTEFILRILKTRTRRHWCAVALVTFSFQNSNSLRKTLTFSKTPQCSHAISGVLAGTLKATEYMQPHSSFPALVAHYFPFSTFSRCRQLQLNDPLCPPCLLVFFTQPFCWGTRQTYLKWERDRKRKRW